MSSADEDRRLDAMGDYLDRMLRGEAADAEAYLHDHPEAEVAGEQVRRLARVLGPGDAPAGLPARIGPFRILRQAGSGGMGIVYLAQREEGGPQVALKVLRVERSADERATLRFQRESQTVSRLDHPHIVSVIESGASDGVQWLAMEWVPGQGLDEVLEKARRRGQLLDPRRVVQWARDLADALHEAHRAGVVHRDVKPSNIRITPDDRAMLLDFGLASLSGATTLSKTGDFRGTPHYAPPEQVRGDRDGVDGRADVYSLAATMYECVAGTPPFVGELAAELFHKILNHDARPPRKLNPSVPKALELVVLKGLEKRPRRRYSNAAELRDDCAALLALRPVRASAPGLGRRAWRGLRRRPALGFSALGIVVALASFQGVQLLRDARARQAVDGGLSEARDRLARGEAQAALDALSALRREHGAQLVEREREWEGLRAEAGAGLELDQLERGLEELPRRRERLVALEEECATLELSMAGRHVPRREYEQYRSRIAERDRERAGWEAELREAGRVLERLRAGPHDAERLRRVNASFAMERWRRGDDRGDRAERERWRDTVETLDREGRYRAELQGVGRLRLAVDADARVDLFRHRDHRQLVPGGDQRRVPVPWRGGEAGLEPGSEVLRVVRGVGELEAEDLIVEIAGAPVASSVFVLGVAGAIDFLPGDRLIEIAGEEVVDIFQAERLLHGPRDAPNVRRRGRIPRDPDSDEPWVVVEADGVRVSCRFADLEEGGLRIGDARELAEQGEVAAVVLREGERLERELPRNLSVRPTAQPLLIGPSSILETGDGQVHELPRGSYLALVRAPDREPVRVPFVMAAGEERTITVTLEPEGHSPPDFVRIVAGPARIGGDPEAFTPLPPERREVAEFWMMDRELLCAEYLEFLNDPETRRVVERSRVPTLYPRDISNEQRGGYFARDRSGDYHPSERWANCAVLAISYNDALAFCRWYERGLRAAGHDFRVSIPDDAQWEKAARGPMGREFPWGDVFVPLWTKGRYARPEFDSEPILRFAIDESVYGIFDLGGNLSEHCSGEFSPGNVTIRGGAFLNQVPHLFRSAGRFGAGPNVTNSGKGIRLVLTRDA